MNPTLSVRFEYSKINNFERRARYRLGDEHPQHVRGAFDLEVGRSLKRTLARQMADKTPLWTRLTEEHGLREMPYDNLVGWPFGDVIFNTEFDMISDMGKIRCAEFKEAIESDPSIVAAIRRLIKKKVLTPFDYAYGGAPSG